MRSARDCIGPPLGREEKVGMELGKEEAGRGYFGKGGGMKKGRRKTEEGGKGGGRRKEGMGRSWG